jgi:hypothetical protein
MSVGPDELKPNPEQTTEFLLTTNKIEYNSGNKSDTDQIIF